MKTFLMRTAAFALAALALFATLLIFSDKEPLRTVLTELTDSTEYATSASAEIMPHIANMQKSDGATKVILGDSVCWQIFDPFNLCNTDYRIDGTNRAVTLAGQYLLAQQFLQFHPEATDVYLVLIPESFSAGADEDYAYQYLVAPFAQAGLLENLDATTQSELRAAYGGVFLRPGLARWFESSPLGKKLYLNSLPAPKTEKGALVPLAVRSLQALADLCAARGVALHLLCAPLPDTENSRAALANLEQAFRDEGLYDTYSSYFTQVCWYDSALFGGDGVHFDSARADQAFFTEVLTAMQQQTGLLEGLVTSY